MATESCTRCGREITRDDQTCYWKTTGRWTSMRFPCVPGSDNTVIQVDRLLIKTGDNKGKPVKILENYYE